MLEGELITKSGTRHAEKLTNLYVDVYSSKKLGELIWLIIKSINLGNEIQQVKRNDIYTLKAKTEELTRNNLNIHQLIVSMLAKGKDRSYKSTMLEIFFDKLENKELFRNFVNYLIEMCNNSSNAIYDITSLLSYTLDYMINEAQDRNLFIDFWYESANKLDSDSRRIFLYETKLNVEQKVKNKILGYSKEYEKQWFASKADYQRIVLEGDCEKCKQPNVIILTHDDYRNLVKNSSIIDGIRISTQKFDCKYCKIKNRC